MMIDKHAYNICGGPNRKQNPLEEDLDDNVDRFGHLPVRVASNDWESKK
jgi:hypothetical protein